MEVINQAFEYLKESYLSLGALLICYGMYKVFRKKDPESTISVSKETQDNPSSSTDSDSSSSDGDMYYKLVLIIRSDLKMGKGKVAAQCAHAAVSAYKQARKHPNILRNWERNGQTKITLKCDDETQMIALHNEARRVGLLSNIVKDAGQTQVAPGTKTVCAVGPGPCDTIDEVTGHLKLY